MLIQEALQCDLERIDAEVLLAHAMQKNRTWLFAHPETPLTTEEESRWLSFRERRQSSEPVAYIIGEKEFYGRTFFVDPSVLIPRPATESLIEEALKMMRGEKIPTITEADTDIVIVSSLRKELSDIHLVADIGTGSGCIAITLACEIPELRIIATDISAASLTIAKKNAEHHSVSDRIEFRLGDGMTPLADIGEPFLMVSNPPYIPSDMTLMKDVEAFEPKSALFSGKKGVDVITSLVNESAKNPFCMGVILECRREQAALISRD